MNGISSADSGSFTHRSRSLQFSFQAGSSSNANSVLFEELFSLPAAQAFPVSTCDLRDANDPNCQVPESETSSYLSDESDSYHDKSTEEAGESEETSAGTIDAQTRVADTPQLAVPELILQEEDPGADSEETTTDDLTQEFVAQGAFQAVPLDAQEVTEGDSLPLESSPEAVETLPRDLGVVEQPKQITNIQNRLADEPQIATKEAASTQAASAELEGVAPSAIESLGNGEDSADSELTGNAESVLDQVEDGLALDSSPDAAVAELADSSEDNQSAPESGITLESDTAAAPPGEHVDAPARARNAGREKWYENQAPLEYGEADTSSLAETEHPQASTGQQITSFDGADGIGGGQENIAGLAAVADSPSTQTTEPQFSISSAPRTVVQSELPKEFANIKQNSESVEPKLVNGPSGNGEKLARVPSAANVQAESRPNSAISQQDRVRLVQRISRSFSRLGPDGGQIQLRLHPPQLGSLNVQVKIEGRSMAAKLTTETQAAREAILEGLPTLRSRLAEQGYDISSFQVELTENGADASFARDLNHGDTSQDQGRSSQPTTEYQARDALRASRLESRSQVTTPTEHWRSPTGIDVDV